jgi:hypothetical protein
MMKGIAEVFRWFMLSALVEIAGTAGCCSRDS